MFSFGTRTKTILGMETSAMTDIVFLLLIFFLLSSSFILRTEIPVSVPKSTSTISQEEDPVVISVTAAGEMFLGDERVTMDELPTALGTRLNSNLSKAVVIRGDEDVPLGTLVEVMDTAKAAGAERMAIATEPKARR